MITRRAEAFAHILRHIPIIIRDEELIVGSSTIAPRGCQVIRNFLTSVGVELDTVETRSLFLYCRRNKTGVKRQYKYVKGGRPPVSGNLTHGPEAIKAIEHNIFMLGKLFL